MTSFGLAGGSRPLIGNLAGQAGAAPGPGRLSPGRLPACDGTSNKSGIYSSLEEDAEDYRQDLLFRRGPPGKSRSGQLDLEKEKETHNYLTQQIGNQRESADGALQTDTEPSHPGETPTQWQRLYEHTSYQQHKHPGPRTDTLSFRLPGVQNFLRILDKEENEQLQSLTRRYTAYRQKLEEALGEVLKPG
ncbi:ras association domain-containing protein 3 [Sigmodon hispidus]